MSESQQDRQVERAALQALDDIARLHDYAVKAVWEQYPSPVPRHARVGSDVSAWSGLPTRVHQ